MAKILVFGNRLVGVDYAALEVADILSGMPGVEFVECDSAENIERYGPRLIILDTAVGIERPVVLDSVDRIEQTKPYSMHDFDLGIMLRLLLKAKKIESVTIIAVPAQYDPQKAAGEVRAFITSILSSGSA